jgi:hypothetical protein
MNYHLAMRSNVMKFRNIKNFKGKRIDGDGSLSSFDQLEQAIYCSGGSQIGFDPELID